MATKVELKASITKWKKVIANPKTKDSVKKILKKSIDKAEKQITDLEGAIEQSKKAALPSAVKSSGQKTAAQLIKEAKDRRQSQGLSTRQSDVEKDAGRKAKPKGYRISKYGNKYWEGRDNRIDVKQPPITYPKLEDGGYMAKGGSLASFKQKFEDNEDQNYHSENVVLLAETFGNDNDIKESKEILAKHLKERGLSKENSEKRDVLFYKLVAKARKEMSKEGISFEDGGMMAKGGAVNMDVIVKTPKGLVTKKDFDGFSKREIIKWCEDRGWVYNEKGEKLGGQILKEYEFFIKTPTRYNVNLPKSKMADGGMMAKGGELKVRKDFEYQNTAKRWLDDHDGKSLAYKVAVLLLKGDKNPNETLNIDYNRYDRILRTLDSISESKHEMAWRTENYSQAEAERWAKESVSEIFELNNMMAEGGEVNGDNMASGGQTKRKKLSKEVLKHHLYKPTGDYFFEPKEDGFIVHMTPKDASNSIQSLQSRFDVESAGKGHYGSAYFIREKMADGGYMAKGGKTQGYDDREDERLAMKYGKIGSKDLDSTKARRDDARFEERGKMADGGIMAKGVDIKKLQIGDEIKFPNGEIWKVSKPGVKYGKVFLAPFNDIAKKGHISIAIEFEPYELKDAVANIMVKGDIVEWEGKSYKIANFDTEANLVYLNTLDGKPALDSKESYLKVHKTRVKIKEKMANGGMMAMGGEVLKEYEVEFTWDTSDDESRSVYIKANSEDEARRKASDRYKAYKEFKIIKVVDTASPYWHD